MRSAYLIAIAVALMSGSEVLAQCGVPNQNVGAGNIGCSQNGSGCNVQASQSLNLQSSIPPLTLDLQQLQPKAQEPSTSKPMLDPNEPIPGERQDREVKRGKPAISIDRTSLVALATPKRYIPASPSKGQLQIVKAFRVKSVR